MISRPLPFFSNGSRLDADLHLPEDDGAGAPYLVLVAASGYQGQKVIHPERFACTLTPHGFAVLAFDYRGFGLSEGERGRLVPQDWAEDIRAAVDRLTTVAHVNTNRIGLIGWGLAAESSWPKPTKIPVCGPWPPSTASATGSAPPATCTTRRHDRAC